MLTASNLFISGFRTALRSRAGAPSGPWFWLLEGLTCFLWGRTVWTFFLSISCLCVFVDRVFLPRGSCWTFFPLPSIQDLAQPVTAGETIWSLHHFLWDLHSFMCFSGPERSKISIMMECPPCQCLMSGRHRAQAWQAVGNLNSSVNDPAVKPSWTLLECQPECKTLYKRDFD